MQTFVTVKNSMLMAAILYKWLMGFITPLMMSNTPIEQAHIREANMMHPFYIAVTEVNHNSTEKTLEISCKMFADDLEAILEKNNNTTLDITTEKDKPDFDKYINAYISKHLRISLDGKAVRLNYLGFENEKESAYAYFEVTEVDAVKKLEITNTILFDFTFDQINIIHITVGGSRQSSKLVYPNTQAKFSF
jgi:hypothetical protein